MSINIFYHLFIALKIKCLSLTIYIKYFTSVKSSGVFVEMPIFAVSMRRGTSARGLEAEEGRVGREGSGVADRACLALHKEPPAFVCW